MLVTALNTKIGYYKAAEIAQKAHKGRNHTKRNGSETWICNTGRI